MLAPGFLHSAIQTLNHQANRLQRRRKPKEGLTCLPPGTSAIPAPRFGNDAATHDKANEMMWRILILAVLGCAWSVTPVTAATDAAVTTVERPNLIVILVDDLGWQDISVPFWHETTAQNRHFRTPFLEQLAGQGLRFTDAHSCCVCSPSRISLLTGQNASRHGTTNWIFSLDQETSSLTPRLRPPDAWRRMGLDPQLPTLPQLLRDRWGYRTIHVGKAHLGARGTETADPRQAGFDVNIAGHAAGHPADYHGQQNFDGTEPSPHAVPGLEAYHGTDTHLTDALTLEANQAISKAVAEQRPFFLHFAHYAVHTPIQPHAPYDEHYREQFYRDTEILIPETEANYASMVEGVDHSVGDLLAHLQKLGIGEQTLVVFLSDNGGLSRHARSTTSMGTGLDTHCWPLREGKGSAYDGGTRVPWIVTWAQPNPNHTLQRRWSLTANSRCAVPTLIEDLFPTLLRMAAQDDSLEIPEHVDGRDLTPLFTSPSADASPLADSPLVFHYPHQWTGAVEGGYQPHSAIRHGPWKAIYFYETKRWELYNLDDDIGELHNLASSKPEMLQALAIQLKNQLIDRNAQWPVNRWTDRPEPLQLPKEVEFPGGQWERKSPAEAQLSAEQLEAVAAYLGGRGCITRDGYLVYEWGDITRPADVHSAVTPWFTHLLIEAIQSEKISSFDTQLAEFEPNLFGLNPEFGNKDILITFRHAATHTSCYGVREKPGQAFNYSDYQVALFCDLLIQRIFETETAEVDSRLLEPLIGRPLQFQDHPSLLAMGDSDRAGRLRISPRDFCRFGLLYLREGVWNGRRIIEPEYARLVTHSSHPANFPRTTGQPSQMLPKQRTIGTNAFPDDQTDHLGSFSWGWWVNGVRKSGQRLWPDAPDEMYACLDHKQRQAGMVVVPAWDLVISWNDSTLESKAWPDPQQDPHPLNEVFRILELGKRGSGGRE